MTNSSRLTWSGSETWTYYLLLNLRVGSVCDSLCLYVGYRQWLKNVVHVFEQCDVPECYLHIVWIVDIIMMAKFVQKCLQETVN